MPKGKRHVVTLEGTGLRFDLSPGQMEMLAKKSIRLKKDVPWQTQQRMNGLVKKHLFIEVIGKVLGKYSRSELGSQVYKVLKARA